MTQLELTEDPAARDLARYGCRPLAPPGWDVVASNLDRGQPDGDGWILMAWQLSSVLGSVFLWARRPRKEAP